MLRAEARAPYVVGRLDSDRDRVRRNRGAEHNCIAGEVAMAAVIGRRGSGLGQSASEIEIEDVEEYVDVYR